MAPEFSVPTPIYGMGPSRFSWMCGTPSGSRGGRARCAGHLPGRLPWPFTLATPWSAVGRRWDAAARQAHGVTQPGGIALTGAGKPSGFGCVPQEQADDRRVDAGDVLLRRVQPVEEVRVDDRRLIQQQSLDLPGELPLGGEVRGGDELFRELVVGGVIEMGGVPGTLPGLGIDGLQGCLEEEVGHGAGAVVNKAHLSVQPVRLPEDCLAVVLRRRLGYDIDV